MKEKICNFECSEAELNEFLKNAEAGAVSKDLGAYSLDVILKCIDLYNEGKMTSIYLKLWVEAYAYLLDSIKEENSKKEFLLSVIADYVRSFARESKGSLESYRNTVLLYDSIYKSLDEWSLTYSVTQKRYPTDEIVNDIEAVFENPSSMEYIILYKSVRGDFPIELEGKWLGLTDLSFYEIQLDNFSFTRLKK